MLYSPLKLSPPSISFFTTNNLLRRNIFIQALDLILPFFAPPYNIFLTSYQIQSSFISLSSSLIDSLISTTFNILTNYKLSHSLPTWLFYKNQLLFYHSNKTILNHIQPISTYPSLTNRGIQKSHQNPQLPKLTSQDQFIFTKANGISMDATTHLFIFPTKTSYPTSSTTSNPPHSDHSATHHTSTEL